MDYHAQIIETFCNNLDYFSVGFEPLEYKKNVKWEGGEVDVLLMGELEKALIEVKSTPNKIGKFTGKQFEKYREFDPSASIYLLVGTYDYSVNPPDLSLKRFWPL